MAKIYVLVGVPGSGKSTATADLIKNGAIAISSDKIREEVFGNEDIQYTEDFLKEHNYNGSENFLEKKSFANQIIFDLVYEKINLTLKNGIDVIFDATNTSVHTRSGIFERVTEPVDSFVAVVLATPFDICVQRNEGRDRKVPLYAMQSIANFYEDPTSGEGFDEIIYINDKNDIDYGVDYYLRKYDNSNDKNAFTKDELIEYINSIDSSDQPEEEYLTDLDRITPIFRALYDFDNNPNNHNEHIIGTTMKYVSELSIEDATPERITNAKIAALFFNTGKIVFKRYKMSDNAEEVFDVDGRREWDFRGFKIATKAIINRILENKGFNADEITDVFGELK